MPETPKHLVLSAHSELIDRRIIAQANALAESGRHVTLVSVQASGTETLSPEIRLVMAGEKLAGQGVLRSLAKRLPRPIKAMGRKVWPAPITDFTAYFESLAPQQEYDAVFCHDLQTLPAGLSLRRKLAPGAKVIFDSHELFPQQFPPGRLRRHWQKVEKEHIGLADAVITVNDSIADVLAKEYGIARPTVLHNSCHLEPCEVSWSEIERHFGLPRADGDAKSFRVLFQGGFSKQKNVQALVEAFAPLGEGFELFLLGGGELENRLRAIVRRDKLANVHFGQWVSQARLLGFVARFDAGVIPYRGDELPNNYYCTPNKLFEYIQAGVPICASDLPELRRIALDGKIGQVYPMRTPEEIASAVSDFAGRCRAGEFRPEAMAAAREEYSWDRQRRKLLDLCQRLGV